MKAEKVFIMEVGPRDGLQNMKEVLTFNQKRQLIQYLLDKGFQNIEAGSFVRADRVPAMADTAQLAEHFHASNDKLWYLVPNLMGLKIALKARATQLAFFTASSSVFNQDNIGMTTLQSLDAIHEGIEYLREQGYHLLSDWKATPKDDKHIKLRLYISTVIGCPFTGKISPKATVHILEELLPLGFAQVSLGDTLGVGTPSSWNQLLSSLDENHFSQTSFALHCHNTYGTALACVREGLNHGIRNFDSSIGGLGGCPYAPGATGNLATEDLIYFLEQEGFDPGIDVKKILDCFDETRTGTLENISQVALALGSQNKCPTQ